jgi:hypothetical protein
MIPSNRLKKWMKDFYHYSSDQNNKDSKLTDEFVELKEIIREVRKLERSKK